MRTLLLTAGLAALTVAAAPAALAQTAPAQEMAQLPAVTVLATRTETRLTWLEAQHADPGALARAQWLLARALLAANGDRARARDLAESARAGFATLGKPGATRASEIQRWLASRR